MTRSDQRLVVQPLSPGEAPFGGATRTGGPSAKETRSEDHYALAVGLREPDGVRGLGFARWLRDRKRTDQAWAQVAVVPSFQGRGLGTLLFRSLGHAARHRSVRTLLVEARPADTSLRAFLARRGVFMVVQGDTLVGAWPAEGAAGQVPRVTWHDLASGL